MPEAGRKRGGEEKLLHDGGPGGCPAQRFLPLYCSLMLWSVICCSAVSTFLIFRYISTLIRVRVAFISSIWSVISITSSLEHSCFLRTFSSSASSLLSSL